eukprot:TRINITY_DN699_c0_g1_i8.p1 TRINITY_DN699_c0_g1~~TRINITY_DN699_c0_g1_i8.p1  ORF type:complete len:397 (-),score=174.57 TRINITY_DN699_c0_g1_i8:53-1243(-)
MEKLYVVRNRSRGARKLGRNGMDLLGDIHNEFANGPMSLPHWYVAINLFRQPEITGYGARPERVEYREDSLRATLRIKRPDIFKFPIRPVNASGYYVHPIFSWINRQQAFMSSGLSEEAAFNQVAAEWDEKDAFDLAEKELQANQAEQFGVPKFNIESKIDEFQLLYDEENSYLSHTDQIIVNEVQQIFLDYILNSKFQKKKFNFLSASDFFDAQVRMHHLNYIFKRNPNLINYIPSYFIQQIGELEEELKNKKDFQKIMKVGTAKNLEELRTRLDILCQSIEGSIYESKGSMFRQFKSQYSNNDDNKRNKFNDDVNTNDDDDNNNNIEKMNDGNNDTILYKRKNIKNKIEKEEKKKILRLIDSKINNGNLHETAAVRLLIDALHIALQVLLFINY